MAQIRRQYQKQQTRRPVGLVNLSSLRLVLAVVWIMEDVP